ncbi:uncharacterized protein LOC128132349 [Lactuca sativa]|uniref:uncharacterized protein LOC128132349 n=1 Tax=Lactuca sativa TaxID=4236 RepID=UPI0022AE78CC|nr:uncharacterized protein LOC128132349 [Lactuca sativa]
MDVDMSNLEKKVKEIESNTDDDGSTEEQGENDSSEDDTSVDEEIEIEEKVNAMINMETSCKEKSGTVINSINLLPSILGDVKNSKKVEGEMQGNLLNSYAGVLKGNRHKGKIDVRFIPGENGEEDGPVIIPIENLKNASIPFTNTFYGYMIDKKLAFPVIQKEVRRLWKNVGLEEVFMNNKGFFFFKFSDEQGMLSILEGSPWLMFNNMPLFLQRWRPGLTLTKNKHDKIPVWIKIFDLPLEVWSGENLCRIASKIGIPLAFDSFTEEMCLEHKGRNAYARILVEMAAGKEWRKKIDISTWDFVSNSAVIQSFDVEYAWIPSRCNHCKVYGHVDKVCVAVMNVEKEARNRDVRNLKNNKGKEVVNGDGFTEVKYKKRRGNYSKGNNGNRGGNGKGQNWNWSNKGVSHWNLEKNRNYEKFANGQDLIGSQGLKENNMKEYVIKKDNKKEEGNHSLVSVTKTGEGFSNKNSFEILGEIEEEALDKMEEDAKIEKVVIHQNEDCGSADMGSNESKNNKMISSIKGEGKKKGNESAWNVRGSNKFVKQKEVIDVIRSNNLGICAVIESHVKVLNLKNICVKNFGQWDWISNNKSCEAGTRIIVGWNPRLFDVIMLSQSKQVIHCYVKVCNSDVGMYLSFIYAASNYIERRLLWDNLKKHSLVVKKEAWGLLGDFNVAIKPSEYSEGCSRTPKGVEDFVHCLSFIEVEDLKSYGFQFTWNKTPAGNMGLLKKLDRVMVNLKFISDHPLAHAVFKPYRNSDHCPAILNFPGDKVKWKPSFRFANFIYEKEEFLSLVKEVWDKNIDGFFMFKVTQKLKILKKHCRELCNKHWGAGKRIQKLRMELECKQQEIDSNPFDCKIREEHANILLDFNVACNDEEKLLTQRAKIKWLQDGDNNSKFFHRIVKSRGNSNRI